MPIQTSTFGRYELARKYGADAILLIAAVLPNQDLKYFQKIANSLGMAALIEVHTYEVWRC